jgi:hypothetical protein
MLGATTRWNKGLFAPYVGGLDEATIEAVYIDYFNNADFITRFLAKRAADPSRTPCPGVDGCEHLSNRDRIEAALAAGAP